MTTREQYKRAWRYTRQVKPFLDRVTQDNWSYTLATINEILVLTGACFPYTVYAMNHLKDRENEN